MTTVDELSRYLGTSGPLNLLRSPGYSRVSALGGRSRDGSADAFSGAVRDFSVAAGALTTDAWRYLMIAGLSGVVQANPVGNPDLWAFNNKTYEYLGAENPFAFAQEGYVGGLSRGNWQVTVGEPAAGVTEDVDQGGAATIAKGSAVINGVDGGELTIGWLANNLPYIEALEDGWSRQAPQGMLGPTFVQLEATAQTIVDALAEQFNREPAR